MIITHIIINIVIKIIQKVCTVIDGKPQFRIAVPHVRSITQSGSASAFSRRREEHRKILAHTHVTRARAQPPTRHGLTRRKPHSSRPNLRQPKYVHDQRRNPRSRAWKSSRAAAGTNPRYFAVTSGRLIFFFFFCLLPRFIYFFISIAYERISERPFSSFNLFIYIYLLSRFIAGRNFIAVSRTMHHRCNCDEQRRSLLTERARARVC